jgi:hypothetical protein
MRNRSFVILEAGRRVQTTHCSPRKGAGKGRNETRNINKDMKDEEARYSVYGILEGRTVSHPRTYDSWDMSFSCTSLEGAARCCWRGE